MNQVNQLEKQGFPKRHLEAPYRFAANGRGSFPEVYRQVTDLIRDRNGTLIALIGPRGTGKTQLAVDVAVRWFEAGLPKPRYVRAWDLVAWLREASNDGKWTGASVTNWQICPLLVIDEIGKLRDSEWTDLVLEHLLDVRYGKGLDTMLVSNAYQCHGGNPSEPFAELMGLSIVNRIHETGQVFTMTEVVRGTGT